MNETEAGFWIKLLGGLLAVACLIIIFLGSYLFEQSTRLAHAGQDLSDTKAEREALATLLAELLPAAPEAGVTAAAERGGLNYRVLGDGPARRLRVEGLSFEIREGQVILDLDTR